MEKNTDNNKQLKIFLALSVFLLVGSMIWNSTLKLQISQLEAQNTAQANLIDSLYDEKSDLQAVNNGVIKANETCVHIASEIQSILQAEDKATREYIDWVYENARFYNIQTAIAKLEVWTTIHENNLKRYDTLFE